jgi:hypothetical protein
MSSGPTTCLTIVFWRDKEWADVVVRRTEGHPLVNDVDAVGDAREPAGDYRGGLAVCRRADGRSS